ncbi:GyrI-like domain-containing protein [uncultured Microbacterium sp.]|uniref:GyrI-like domain-containing protein n=1 Tax=uncultured Microbacterium sp. TaxID=191216 RepID=UPI0025DABA8B|nr:effector binding domain-containing protein [uncultured Microbacterium sp.]
MRTHQDAFTVIGLPLRTRNSEALRTIPPHWAAFSRADVAARLGLADAQEVFAVYTDHEHSGVDNLGAYTLVIGHRVPSGTAVPDGLSAAQIPASEREVIALEPARPDLVGEAWQRIWARDDLALTYVSDFERYGPEGAIEISLGLRSAE